MLTPKASAAVRRWRVTERLQARHGKVSLSFMTWFAKHLKVRDAKCEFQIKLITLARFETG
jgi:hypothetical protein